MLHLPCSVLWIHLIQILLIVLRWFYMYSSGSFIWHWSNPRVNDLSTFMLVKQSWRIWDKWLYMLLGAYHIDDLVQDCSNSIANALELLQSCPKPSIKPKQNCVHFCGGMMCISSSTFPRRTENSIDRHHTISSPKHDFYEELNKKV